MKKEEDCFWWAVTFFLFVGFILSAIVYDLKIEPRLENNDCKVLLEDNGFSQGDLQELELYMTRHSGFPTIFYDPWACRYITFNSIYKTGFDNFREQWLGGSGQ